MEESEILTKISKNIEGFVEAFQKSWREIHDPEKTPNYELFKSNNPLLNSLAQDDNVLFLIFDAVHYEFLYVGKNLETFTGYTIQEVGNRKLQFIFKILRLEHLLFFAKSLEATRLQKKFVPDERLAEFFTFSAVGLTFKHKLGHLVKIMYRAYPLAATKENPVAIQLFELRNVSHLLKMDGFWMRIISGLGENRRFFCYNTNEKKRPYSWDVISDRELEVLKLIADGKTTHEIAAQLFISPNTVDTHRKHMIARLGVRDSIALAEICRRVGVF